LDYVFGVRVTGSSIGRPVLTFALSLLSAAVQAQPAPGGPPAVGVVRAERQQMTQTDEFIGRIQAVGRVALVARVSAFLEQRLFMEGSEVKKGDLLYRLEQPPFQAQVQASQATVEQLQAQHRNAELTLQRAQQLLARGTGTQANVDAALASERALAAQIAGAQAQLRQAEINLTIPKFVLRSTARSAARKLPRAILSRQLAGLWRLS
jgi:membrane fusion protein (multidrug efflux system)